MLSRGKARANKGQTKGRVRANKGQSEGSQKAVKRQTNVRVWADKGQQITKKTKKQCVCVPKGTHTHIEKGKNAALSSVTPLGGAPPEPQRIT